MKKIVSVILCWCFISVPKVFAEIPFDGLNAKSMLLAEASEGKILCEYNADEKLPIASVTKIMTMLLIMEAIDSGKIKLDDMVPVSERAMSMGGSTMFLETGESLSVSDMLKGIAVASANDGAVAMAEFIAGSESAFVDMMNKRAKELGMKNTHFENTNGLDADNHYSTAKDVAIMSGELLKHEKIFEYTTIWTDTLRNGKFQLANTNKLIRFYSGANGLKTGSTSKALCCISAAAKRDNLQLIAVVLAAPTSKERFAAARGLLDFGFANYTAEAFVKKEETVAQIPVLKGKKEQISIKSAEDCTAVLKKEEQGKAERKINVPEVLTAPINEGDIVGTADFVIDGKIVKSVELVAASSVDKKSCFDFFAEILQKWITC